jgi:hypothetical protein
MYSTTASGVPMPRFGAAACSMFSRVALLIRAPWALSVVYRALMSAENVNPLAGQLLGRLLNKSSLSRRLAAR